MSKSWLVNLILLIVIVVIVLGVVYLINVQVDNHNKRENIRSENERLYAEERYGRHLDYTDWGSLYKVMAIDNSRNIAIVMPWLYGHDEEVTTDRRILVSVDDNVCKAGSGTWFVRTNSGDKIVAPPVIKTESNKKK